MWEKIEQILIEKKMTEEELHKKLSPAGKESIRRMKAGETRNPSYDRVCEITKILGVTTDAIRADNY